MDKGSEILKLCNLLTERILFARKDMSFEGLGLGWCEPQVSHEKWSVKEIDLKEIMSAVVRILGERKYTIVSDRASKESMPKFLESYLEESAIKIGCNPNELISAVGAQVRLSRSFDNYLIKVDELNIRSRQGSRIFRCRECGRKHLYKAGGICTNTKCLGILEQIDVKADELEEYGGYYARQAKLDIQPYRLHCEELSGQTDDADRPDRQRWFQGVVHARENERTDTIDLLSVTTTLEAGVDIGALSMVLMGNVPPQRFNYQQRVGRTGRRGDPVSYALTLCRLRTHDEHYFTHTNEITNAPTPPPYLDLGSHDIIKRVLTKEVLYRVFVDNPQASVTSSDNVHGNFGTVKEWESNRDTVTEWIAKNKSTIERIVRLLSAQAERSIADATEEITNWVMDTLVSEIDQRAKEHPFEHDDLSEALAQSGLLPMFGFPTGVRLLYHKKPESKPWPPKSGTIDRDIEIAISQFASGSETVKDKKVHTSIGIVSYSPTWRRYAESESGIAHPRQICFCQNCKAILTESVDENQCPICGETEKFKKIEAIEPKGFLTDFQPIDAKEYFRWTPRATYSRLPSDLPVNLKSHLNFRCGTSKLRLFSVNDNSGELFSLCKRKGDSALVSADVWGELAQKNDYYFDKKKELKEETQEVALYAAKTTDVLLIEVDEIPEGIQIDPTNIYGRSALYSFGFLLRQCAASRMLDVNPQELRVEHRSVRENGKVRGQVFLADALANGAGYCRHIGEPERLKELLREMTESDFASKLVEHGDKCDASCYRCMRDYSNMSYHPLLDWRLGLDLAHLCLKKDYQIDLQKYWKPLVDRVEENLKGLIKDYGNLKREDHYGVPVFVERLWRKAFVLHHPLWLIGDWSGPQLARVIVDFDETAIYPEYINIFDLIRRPGKIVNKLRPGD